MLLSLPAFLSLPRSPSLLQVLEAGGSAPVQLLRIHGEQQAAERVLCRGRRPGLAPAVLPQVTLAHPHTLLLPCNICKQPDPAASRGQRKRDPGTEHSPGDEISCSSKQPPSLAWTVKESA